MYHVHIALRHIWPRSVMPGTVFNLITPQHVIMPVPVCISYSQQWPRADHVSFLQSLLTDVCDLGRVCRMSTCAQTADCIDDC